MKDIGQRLGRLEQPAEFTGAGPARRRLITGDVGGHVLAPRAHHRDVRVVLDRKDGAQVLVLGRGLGVRIGERRHPRVPRSVLGASDTSATSTDLRVQRHLVNHGTEIGHPLRCAASATGRIYDEIGW